MKIVTFFAELPMHICSYMTRQRRKTPLVEEPKNNTKNEEATITKLLSFQITEAKRTQLFTRFHSTSYFKNFLIIDRLLIFTLGHLSLLSQCCILQYPSICMKFINFPILLHQNF